MPQRLDQRPETLSGTRPLAAPEISVVIPCLNEADTIESCVGAALAALSDAGLEGEVIVADNGSTDGSPEIARKRGARVVPVHDRGYGNALMGGIAAARGRFIIMGDADLSYDFSTIPRFVERLRAGDELVMGCRLPVGGGHVMPGAMPPLHRWLGNPVLSQVVRWWFRAPIHDVHCGLRGFSRQLYDRLDLQCTGMEFASEMVVKAAMHSARMGEVPIVLHKDGRVARGSHLRTFRDGWRHLRFYLLFSPRWLFLMPGATLIAAGLVVSALAIEGVRIGGAQLDVNALLFASLAVILGYQSVLFAFLTKGFAIGAGLMPMTRPMSTFFRVFNLERGAVIGIGGLLIGLALLWTVWMRWQHAGFGGLDYPSTLRLTIPGVVATALGAQTVLASFFASILGLRRR